MKKEQWDAGRARAGGHRRGRAGQPGVGAVGAAEVRDHRRAVPRVLQARGARRRAAAGVHAREGRGAAGVHAAAVHPAARAVRSVGPRPPPRHQALCPSRVHHGRRGAADAGVPALRARRHRLERSAAQRLARDPAAVARRAGHSRRVSEARPDAARGTGGEAGREVRDVLDGVRPRVQGRRSPRIREPRADREAAAVRVDARATATRRPCRSPTTSGA